MIQVLSNSLYNSRYAKDPIQTQKDPTPLELSSGLGLTEITGPGLEVVLDDGLSAFREAAEVTDENLVQASDLRDLVKDVNDNPFKYMKAYVKAQGS